MNSWTATLTQALHHAWLVASWLDLALKSFVILGVAGGLCVYWRRGSAAGRHLAWLLAVAGLLCLPVLSWLLPAARTPLWAVGGRTESLNELTLTLALTPPKASFGWAGYGAASPAAPRDPGAAHALSAGGQQLAAHLQTGWAAGVLAVWLSGFMLVLLWLVIGHLRVWCLRHWVQVVPSGEHVPLVRQLCEEMRLRRPVTLFRSAQGVMPVTWGSFRPRILLPAEADDWSPERLRVVLMHELAHIKRWDCLTQTLARLACAVYWFNPLAWLAARRMCVERERACDDLVLNGGCKASDYAMHLVDIVRSFRPMPAVAAIGMVRSSNLEGRVAAIVDGSRARRAPRALAVALGCLAMIGFAAVVAAQKPQAGSATTQPGEKPWYWYDARLRAYFAAKQAQARQLAGTNVVAPEVWPFFEAGMRGDWLTATNLWTAMRQRAHQYEGTTADATLDKVWGPILELDLAWQSFDGFKEKYVLTYGNDIINSIPAGSIYFGGTDPGRGVITAMCKSHAAADPFFTLTQNALADGTYLDYLRAMYGATIYIPTGDDSQRCFAEYSADALRRMKDHTLKPGEQITEKDGKLDIRGQVAVMSINGLLSKVVFDHNPDREFYLEESFPLDWMYPYLIPNGLIMKINRQPLTSLPDAAVQQDLEYWSHYLQPMLGAGFSDGTSVADMVAFVEKVYLQHDLAGFSGDREWVEDTWAQKAYSKLRSSIAGVYAWRVAHATTPEEKQRMVDAADLAFRQAYALCPSSPETVFRYVSFLISLDSVTEARLLTETSLKFDPKNAQMRGLLDEVNSKTKN